VGAGGSRGGPPGWRIDDAAAMETAAAATVERVDRNRI